MVMAATRKISRIGIHSNRGRTSAMLREKKASTQKNTNRLTARKVARNTNATGDEKNRVSSLRAMRNTLCSGCMGYLRRGLVDLAEQGFQIADFRTQGEQLAAGLDHRLGNLGTGTMNVAARLGGHHITLVIAFDALMLDLLQGGQGAQHRLQRAGLEIGAQADAVALLQLGQRRIQR